MAIERESSSNYKCSEVPVLDVMALVRVLGLGLSGTEVKDPVQEAFGVD